MRSLLKRILFRVAGGYVERIVQGASVVNNPYLSAKLVPFERRVTTDGEHLVVWRRSAATLGTESETPVPPPELREGWWGADEDYLEPGRRDLEKMLRSLETVGASPPAFQRVLDFGCAAGRMLRFFPEPERRECWGVDIKSRHIAWCQEHLSPPFFFASTTTLPHLPFEDDYFDLVYCSSVFTHIGDLPDATLLELRRVLRPGGFAYLTIHDEHSIESLLHRYPERGLTDMLRRLDAENGILHSDYAFFFVGADPWTLVFYDSGYLIDKWSRLMEFESIFPDAMDYQTALVLRKRLRSDDPRA